MHTLTAATARSKLSALLDQVNASHEPILIVGKRNNAVLISEEDWRALNETLALISIPGMRESLLDGTSTPIAECEDGSTSWDVEKEELQLVTLPANILKEITGIIAVGGDALLESEHIYDDDNLYWYRIIYQLFSCAHLPRSSELRGRFPPPIG